MQEVKTRFEKYVDKDGPIMKEGMSKCWCWCGAFSYTSNRGMFGINGKSITAHRAAAIIYKNEDLLGQNHVVKHFCGKVNCVNPDHLYVYTKDKPTTPP